MEEQFGAEGATHGHHVLHIDRRRGRRHTAVRWFASAAETPTPDARHVPADTSVVSGPVVELQECGKRFGERVALRRVTLRVASGETLAVLGANGSGKSTLLRVVAGLVRPTVGTALLDGVAAAGAPPAVRGRIGYVAHRSMAYRGLTAAENLRLFARLHAVEPQRVAEVLDQVGLSDRADERIDGFSRGMTQRLSIARALLHGPDLLLLDEATTGLDAEGRAVLEGVMERGRGHVTTIFATHDAEAARRQADRVLTLRDGTPA